MLRSEAQSQAPGAHRLADYVTKNSLLTHQDVTNLRRRRMGSKIGKQTRRELLESLRERYGHASKIEKTKESRQNNIANFRPRSVEWSACGTSQSRPSKRSTPAWSPCSMSGPAASGLLSKPEPSAGGESLTSPRPPDCLGSPSKPV